MLSLALETLSTNIARVFHDISELDKFNGHVVAMGNFNLLVKIYVRSIRHLS